MIKKTFLLLILCLFISASYAQDNWMIKGYVKGMTAMQSVEDGNMAIENTLHNRFDMNWYINDNFTFTAGLRNRIIAGNNVSLIPNYSDFVARDFSYFDMTWIWAENNSWIGISQLDRLMFDYNKGSITERSRFISGIIDSGKFLYKYF